MTILSPFGFFPLRRTNHDMVGELGKVYRQEIIQRQFINVAFHALIQKALKRFVKLITLRRADPFILICQMVAVLTALTRQGVRIANGIRVSLLYCIDIHRVKRAPEIGGIFAHDLLQLLGGLAKRAVEIPVLFSVEQTSHNTIDGLVVTNKSGHGVLSFLAIFNCIRETAKFSDGYTDFIMRNLPHSPIVVVLDLIPVYFHDYPFLKIEINASRPARMIARVSNPEVDVSRLLLKSEIPGTITANNGKGKSAHFEGKTLLTKALKLNHDVFSYSRCKPLSGGCFLSRETGLCQIRACV
jgi:hypothetical protein